MVNRLALIALTVTAVPVITAGLVLAHVGVGVYSIYSHISDKLKPRRNPDYVYVRGTPIHKDYTYAPVNFDSPMAGREFSRKMENPSGRFNLESI